MQIKKTPLLFVLGSIMALGPFSIDMYLPAFQSMATDLGTDTAKVGYSLTSFFAGLFIGQMFYGILIDRFGRKKPLIAGYIIYILASLGCAFAPTLDSLVAFRFLMALGGCSGMVISRAVVRDVFSGNEIAKTFSQLVLVMGIAPIIAPTIGGFVNSWLGWRWLFGTMVLIALANLMLIIFVLPETKGPDTSISLKPKSIWSEYHKVLRFKSFILYAVAGSFAYAGLFAYLTASPSEFMERLGMSDTQYGWAFAFNASGFIIGSQVNRLILMRHNELSASLRSLWTQLGVAVALLVFSYMHMAGITLTLISTFLYLFMLGILNPNTQALALRPFIKEAGRSAALMGSIQMIAGVLTSGLVSFLHGGDTPTMAIAMLVCTSISLILLLISRFGNIAEANPELQKA
ncbi:MAG: Bcr/CflA family drug resistance efflux transporter [Flammeovirgaceae bacterium]|nr:Bcr/CflA family drug resistance efflux transporter [Flammeovirgaceae bacterium]MBE61606.1 Bcr/CflA family drug resistance efflux transporter [Flammeovirgaceae bacterium]MBR10238.1 Bcr/CflA family drug resistance efflux transporter [Rickettsiales bacterium]HCX22859.1 Bcr/CflA family drug resistance efflux transporter [Cytophagales bacterium]